MARSDDRVVGLRRQTEYWTDLAGGAAAAKELRLFGLGGWVVARRLESHSSGSEPSAQRAAGVRRRQGATTFLGAAALAALLVPGMATWCGSIGVDALATCLVAAWGIFQMGGMVTRR